MKTLKPWLFNVVTLIVVGLFFVAQGVGAKPDAQPAQPLAPSQTLISYQGTLTDPSGNPINDTLSMEFALYGSSSGTDLKWGPEPQTVQVSNGLFHVLLGSVTPIEVADLIGDSYLDIKVSDEPLSPREMLGAVAYAMEARHLVTKDTQDVSANAGGIEINDKGGSTLRIDGNELDSTGGLYLQKEHGDQNVYIYSDLDMRGSLITNLDGIAMPFKLKGERSWEFKNYDSGSGTKTALRSTSDAKYFQFRNQDDSVILSIYANNSSGGYLSMNGHSIKNCGALTEANLQTEEDLSAERIDRFEEGDVLCWAGEQLEKCNTANDLLVQAVADADGRPIVIGAEVVKVIGPVRYGDLLVASDVPGYAMVNNDPRAGVVIAQALEDFDGEQGIIKAMIRKF